MNVTLCIPLSPSSKFGQWAIVGGSSGKLVARLVLPGGKRILLG